MRVPAILLAALTTAAMLASSGCQLIGNESSGPTCSSQEFSLVKHPALLGDRKGLVRAFDEAVQQQLQSATMAEMVQRAGWTMDWDRAIYIGTGTTDARLKERAGVDLELACFTSLPQESSNSDLASPYVTLFLSEGKPVQAEWWYGQNPRLDFGEREFLTPDTTFYFDPNPGVMVAQ
ncbi:hypothetical protein [Nocardia harenae]|uniref:hypothetical protein n=1 Tax=Nocardia harenae TaxID=358707 RepID=UPI0008370853|nr:hypothetical protein [Nocardia harenae]